MSDDSDEDVVFKNSPLYEHLVANGFTDFESASCMDNVLQKTTDLSTKSAEKVDRMCWRAADLLRLLCLNIGAVVAPQCRQALQQSTLLNAEDGRVVTEFYSSLEDPTEGRRLTRVPWCVSAAVLFAAVAATGLLTPVCLLALLPVICYVIVRMSSARQLSAVNSFIASASEARSTVRKCVRLLTEARLLSRGIALSMGDVDVDTAFELRYGNLTRSCGSRVSTLCSVYQSSLRQLRNHRPLIPDAELSYAFSENGAASTTTTVVDLKSAFRQFVQLQSSFTRHLCLSLCPDALPLPGDQLLVPVSAVRLVTADLHQHSRLLDAAYRLHVTPSLDVEAAVATENAGLWSSGAASELGAAVHAVFLQCESASFLARLAEESANCSPTTAEELRCSYKELTDRVQAVRDRSSNIALMCDSVLSRVARETETKPSSVPALVESPSSAPPCQLAVPHLPEAEPVVDQFLEAVADESGFLRPPADDSDSEERIQSRLNRANAGILLRELDIALEGKRREWAAREAAAKGGIAASEPASTDDGRRLEELDDKYRVDISDLNRFSGSEDDVSPSDTEKAEDAVGVLPRPAELDYLLPSIRRAPPPLNRQRPSRPGSISSVAVDPAESDRSGTAGLADGEHAAPATTPGNVAANYEVLPETDTVAEEGDVSMRLADSHMSRATSKYDPKKFGGFGFPSQLAAQAAAQALKRRSKPAAIEEEEVYGSDNASD